MKCEKMKLGKEKGQCCVETGDWKLELVEVLKYMWE